MKKILKSYVTFKINTLGYYGTYEIRIDSYNLYDVIDYNYTYILLGILGRLNTLKKLYNIQSCAGPQTFWVSLKRILLKKVLTQVKIDHPHIPWKILKIWKVLKALYFTKFNQYKMSYLLTNRLLRFGERKFMLRNCWYQRFSEFSRCLSQVVTKNWVMNILTKFHNSIM